MKRLLIALALLAGGCNAGPPCPKTYDVKYLPGAKVVIDGNMNDTAWRGAVSETGFSFPWENRAAPATEFRAFFDDERFYFVFKVRDADVVLEEPYTGEEAVRREDRVELFFTRDQKLREYYCLEIDPRGRVSDYSAIYYRQFNRDWTCPDLKVTGVIVKHDSAAASSNGGDTPGGGYIVEGSIPHATFESLGLPSLRRGEAMTVGVFRAQFSHGPTKDPIEAWLSWVRPATEKPDFHVPSAFGCFRPVGLP